MVWSIRSLIIYLLDLVIAVIAFFIGLRIVFRLFNANSATPFVAWITAVSEGLIAPFSGILPNLDLGVGVLDIVAMIALIAYMLIAYVVMSVVSGIMTPTATIHDHEHAL
jgi:hypothetical protein